MNNECNLRGGGVDSMHRDMLGVCRRGGLGKWLVKVVNLNRGTLQSRFVEPRCRWMALLS